jgi:hypothetical protein
MATLVFVSISSGIIFGKAARLALDVGGILQGQSFTNKFTRQWSIKELADRYELRYYNNTEMVHRAAEQAYIDSLVLSDLYHLEWCRENIQVLI